MDKYVKDHVVTVAELFWSLSERVQVKYVLSEQVSSEVLQDKSKSSHKSK